MGIAKAVQGSSDPNCHHVTPLPATSARCHHPGIAYNVMEAAGGCLWQCQTTSGSTSGGACGWDGVRRRREAHPGLPLLY